MPAVVAVGNVAQRLAYLLPHVSVRVVPSSFNSATSPQPSAGVAAGLAMVSPALNPDARNRSFVPVGVIVFDVTVLLMLGFATPAVIAEPFAL